MCLLSNWTLAIDFIDFSHLDIIIVVEFSFCNSLLHVTDLAKVCKAVFPTSRTCWYVSWDIKIASLVHVNQIYIQLWLILINSFFKGLLRPLSISWLSFLCCRRFIFSKVHTIDLSAHLWWYTAFQQRMAHRIRNTADAGRRLWFWRDG